MSPPPAARRVPHRLELHGDVRIDDYYWLRDITGPEAQAHLAAEAAYAAAVTRRLGPLRDALAAEMTARGPAAPDPPVLENGYWYYSRPGDQYPTHLRRKDAPGAAEEVVLDLDEVAGGSSYLDVGDWKVSDDGSRLAFTADRTGSGDYELTVRELPSGRVVESGTPAAAPVAWAADGRTLFYLTQDATRRENRVWRRAVGQSAADDLVYEEADESYWLELSPVAGRPIPVPHLDRVRRIGAALPAADRPDGVWQTILPRRAGHEYDADHRAGRFYLRTNEDAPNFRVVTCPVGRADPAGWAELVPHDPAVCVERLTLFRDFAVVADRADARPGLRVIDLETGAGRRVEVPGAVYDLTVLPTGFDDRTTRTEYSSPVVRPTGVRVRPGERRPDPGRPDRLPGRADVCDRPGRGAGAGVGGRPGGAAPGRVGRVSTPRVRGVRAADPDRVRPGHPRPPGPGGGLRLGLRPGRGRPRPGVVRGRPTGGKTDLHHRLHRLRQPPGVGRLLRPGSAGGRGAQRRRVAGRGRPQPPAGPVPGGRPAVPVRRRSDHHVGPDPAAGRAGVPPMGATPGGRPTTASSRGTARTRTCGRRPTRRCWSRRP
jgi:hypothetical protein